MRGITVFILGWSVLATGCNSIIGVEDVRQRSVVTKPKPASEQRGEDGDDEDGDPSTTGAPISADDEDTEAIERTPECNGTADCKRLAFVTSETFTGKLGGLAGADQKCFEAAKKIPGFGGRAFRAWLSDSTSSANERLPKGTAAYRRLDGAVVATSFTDLTDGSLALPLFLDETGVKLPTGLAGSVWTGASIDGADSTFNCFDWTSDALAQSGTFGDSHATDATWTDLGQSSCNAARHLYCVEY